MSQRRVRIVVTAVLGLFLLSLPSQALAKKYRYGGSSGGFSGGKGFIVSLEGGITNPRNTDNVVATTNSAAASPIIPDWDDEFAGRVRLGYQWSNGNRLGVSLWNFSAETGAADTSSILLAIGPPVPSVGDAGTSYSIGTEIEAFTLDIDWARSHELSESLTMEWSLGLRVAEFEETASGNYGGVGTGAATFNAFKSNLGEMIGLRAGVRGSFRVFPSISLGGGLAFSMLDGENSASSSLTPPGSGTPSSFASLVDDGRSGSIRDFDAVVTWHSSSDAVRIWFGWEQSEWDGIAEDLMRNFPGTSAPLRDRDSVVFSGYKLGLYLRF